MSNQEEKEYEEKNGVTNPYLQEESETLFRINESY